MRLLIALAALALFLAWANYWWSRDDDTDPLRLIVRAGGGVTRDDSLPNSPVVAVTLSTPNRYLLTKLAAFDQLKRLDLRGGGRESGKSLNELFGLRQLQELLVDPVGIDDDTLTVLFRGDKVHILSNAKGKIGQRPKNADEIVELDLEKTLITDTGVRKVLIAKNLKSLNLSRTKIEGVAFYDLFALKSLEKLNLAHTPVTDYYVSDVGKWPALTELNLQGTWISDEGLATVHQCQNLKSLNLARTSISNTGLKQFASLPKLEILDLSGTSLTDASLPLLANMKSLKTLDLSGTKVSQAAVQQLQKALPDCFILAGP